MHIEEPVCHERHCFGDSSFSEKTRVQWQWLIEYIHCLLRWSARLRLKRFYNRRMRWWQMESPDDINGRPETLYKWLLPGMLSLGIPKKLFGLHCSLMMSCKNFWSREPQMLINKNSVSNTKERQKRNVLSLTVLQTGLFSIGAPALITFSIFRPFTHIYEYKCDYQHWMDLSLVSKTLPPVLSIWLNLTMKRFSVLR